MSVYNAESNNGWSAQEIWQEGTDAPDVTALGISTLTVDATNAFVVSDDYSSISATGASVYSDRVWDTVDSGNGYAISSDKERAFDFIGWYYIYDATPCGGRLLQDTEAGGEPEAEPTPVAAAPKDWAQVCGTTIKGQSEEPQIFILGAFNGLAVASAAILTAMLF